MINRILGSFSYMYFEKYSVESVMSNLLQLPFFVGQKQSNISSSGWFNLIANLQAQYKENLILSMFSFIQQNLKMLNSSEIIV